MNQGDSPMGALRFSLGAVLAIALFTGMGARSDGPAKAEQDLVLKVEGKLTAGDPKDKVRKDSYHKVHTVKLEKDVVYRIDLISAQFDAYLRLEDADGKQLEENDNGPVLTHSRIYFKPASA